MCAPACFGLSTETRTRPARPAPRKAASPRAGPPACFLLLKPRFHHWTSRARGLGMPAPWQQRRAAFLAVAKEEEEEPEALLSWRCSSNSLAPSLGSYFARI